MNQSFFYVVNLLKSKEVISFRGEKYPPAQGRNTQFYLFLEFPVSGEHSFALCKRHLKPKTARIRHLTIGSHEPIVKCRMFAPHWGQTTAVYMRSFRCPYVQWPFFIHKQMTVC